MLSLPEYLGGCGAWNASRERRELPSHRDPALEIILVRRGQVEWRFPDHSRTASAGDVTWTWPWETHAGGRGISTSAIVWLQLRLAGTPRVRPRRCPAPHSALGFPPAEGREILAALWDRPTGRTRGGKALCELIPRLYDRLDREAPYRGSWLRNQTRQLLIELAERCRGEEPAPRPLAARERVRVFARRLPDRAGEVWTLEEMAGACGLGRTQFARHFAELRGETPMRHLNRLRIEAAMERLRADNGSVTDIAFDCGFGSSQHFARVFKQFTGLRPREVSRHPHPPPGPHR